MFKLIIKKLLILLLVVAVAGIVAAYYYQQMLKQPLNISTDDVIYTVKPGSNIRQISHEIKKQGLLSQPAWLLEFYARSSGQAAKIKAGEYQLQAGTTIATLLDQLVSGKVLLHAFTIVEGLTTQELLLALQKQAALSRTLENVKAAHLVDLLKIEQGHAEGVFLPETYHFPSGTTDVEFLQRAYQQMQSALMREWENRADDLPYKSPYQALIMASIIEKETGIAEERPEIAGVFVRRLQKGMRLQTDPTVIYGMGEKFDGNLRRKDLKTDTAYNTYTRHGLPPTPICLPSIESIHAALHPAAGNSLYFVAKGDEGRHVFSSNLADHNKAVRRYQLKK